MLSCFEIIKTDKILAKLKTQCHLQYIVWKPFTEWSFPTSTLVSGGTWEAKAFDVGGRWRAARFSHKSSTNIQGEVTWKVTLGRSAEVTRGGLQRAPGYLAGGIVTAGMSVFHSLGSAFQLKFENLSSLFNIWFSHSLRDKTALSLSSHLLKCT